MLVNTIVILLKLSISRETVTTSSRRYRTPNGHWINLEEQEISPLYKNPVLLKNIGL